MSKRSANSQIAKDDDLSEESASVSFAPFKRASADVLKTRKIIKPRGRSDGRGPSKSASSPFTINPPPQLNSIAVNKNGSNNKNELIKALNDKVIDYLVGLNKPNQVANFTPVFEKYIEFYGKIQRNEIDTNSVSGSVTKSGQTPAPSSAEAPITVNESSTESESEKEDIQLTGPKFELSVKPQIKNSPFSFGPKKEQPKDDSDSESEVEIKGPVFTFNKTIKDNVFKFNKPEESKEKSTFSSGSTAPTTEKPAFSFGSASTTAEKPVDKPAFSFGSTGTTAEKPAPKPAFSFGSTPTVTNETANTPAFSFGSSTSVNDKAPEKSFEKPAFSFGSKPDTPAFSFGANTPQPTEQSADKPAFSFGAKSSDAPANDKPAFSFAVKADQKPAEKPSFSFGAKPASVEPQGSVTEKAGFSFSSKPESTGSAQPVPEKPAFSFGDKPTDKPTFSFGTNTDKPTFSFGSSEAKPAEKPAFSFNSQPTDKPAFSFGGNSNADSSDKPAFSFGSSASKPAFSFGSSNTEQKSDKPAFSFGGSSASTFQFGTQPQNKDNATESTPSEEQVEESEPKGNFTPVVQLTEKVESNTGEENEGVEYTKRAKIMLFEKEKNPPYTTKGVGELKLLKNSETGKSRILVRADGGLRVLLNSGIQGNFQYETISDGLVRFPVINSDQKLDTFVIKVKTKDDGEQLVAKLNELKN